MVGFSLYEPSPDNPRLLSSKSPSNNLAEMPPLFFHSKDVDTLLTSKIAILSA